LWDELARGLKPVKGGLLPVDPTPAPDGGCGVHQGSAGQEKVTPAFWAFNRIGQDWAGEVLK